LIFIFFGLQRFVPEFAYKPLKMIGDCTVPLAMFVVSGALAQIKLRHVDKKAVFLIVLAKLILLPLAGMFLIARLNLPPLLGLLIIMQLAMPPATSLAVIMTHQKREDLLIGQGIFFGHLVSIISMPIFLSLYISKFGF